MPQRVLLASIHAPLTLHEFSIVTSLHSFELLPSVEEGFAWGPSSGNSTLDVACPPTNYVLQHNVQYAVIQLHVPAESELLISGVFERDKRRYIASFPSYIVPQSWKMSGMERYKKIRTLGTSTQP